MTLTPFHSEPIWESYDSLRPRNKSPYKEALLKAIDGCLVRNISPPRVLVLGAGPGTYDVELLFEALSESKISPSFESITVVDWHRHKSLRSDINFINQDIEEFLAGDSVGSFDIVVAFLVVHHLVNWRLATANIAKVASGGFLVFDEYECMKAGWLDWIDGTTGFIGLDSQLPQSDAVGKWAAFFRDYYSHLNKEHGIFWEPEVRGTDYKRFHRALTYSGFHKQGDYKKDIFGKIQQLSESFYIEDHIDPARLFSQFAWGSVIGGESYLKQFIDKIPDDKFYAFIKEFFKSENGKINSSSSVSEQGLTFTIRVSTYEIPKAESLPVVANRMAETYWFEGFHDALFHRLLLLHIEALSSEPKKSAEYEKLQRKKLVQYLVFSGCFTQSLIFAAPVLMHIKKISGWKTQTSKDSILVINDASKLKGIINGHLKRMADYIQNNSVGSLTESFLSLRLPLSIILRAKEPTEESGGYASVTLHRLHTGKLVEIAIPTNLLGDYNDALYDEDVTSPIHPEWFFSRFRAGVLTIRSSALDDEINYNKQKLEFSWDTGSAVSENASHEIESWVNKILPLLSPILKLNVRAVILGLYHVRVDDERYGGLGSVFLAEEIAGKLTAFDVERFRFMQAEAQKFSSIYMIESLRGITLSEENLAKQMVKFTRLAADIENLKGETQSILLQRGHTIRKELGEIRKALINPNSSLCQSLFQANEAVGDNKNRGVYHCCDEKTNKNIDEKLLQLIQKEFRGYRDRMPLLASDPILRELFVEISQSKDAFSLVHDCLRKWFTYANDKHISEWESLVIDDVRHDSGAEIHPFHIRAVCSALIHDGFTVESVEINKFDVKIAYKPLSTLRTIPSEILITSMNNLKKSGFELDRWIRFHNWPFAFPTYYGATVNLFYPGTSFTIQASEPGYEIKQSNNDSANFSIQIHVESI
jgi:hypothetical protein